ncbi:DUF815 domain-containing protein, partial [Alloalcanivorax venustensis]|uniref:DUF815 domain-containing protein n=1 Tax=Alloalcanivorax venustensis TaxID=172371 RepID=UPI0035136A82
MGVSGVGCVFYPGSMLKVDPGRASKFFSRRADRGNIFDLISNGDTMNHVDWRAEAAAIWRPRQQRLRPVRHLDPVALDDLLGVDTQKRKLVQNTDRFLAGKPAMSMKQAGSISQAHGSLPACPSMMAFSMKLHDD